MTREEGINMVKKYDGKCGEKYIRDFCDYIDIDLSEFYRVRDSFVNKKLFYREEETGEWKPKFVTGKDFKED
ncbi:MAG: hypothetical protein ACOC56_03555 [Atribacterota bacterium]